MSGPRSPALIAADQFTRRQRWLRAQIAARRVTLGAAEDKLRPWLSIAAMAGADLEELHYIAPTLWPPENVGQLQRFRWYSWDICPRDQALAELARARDASIEAGAPDARDLNTLAWALDAPFAQPAALERAA